MKNFEWTDELAQKYADSLYTFGSKKKDRMREFKEEQIKIANGNK